MRIARNNLLFLLTPIALLVLYLCLRLLNILSLPLFTDEAIYIRWAQIAAQDANWRFISLTDGKQPSFIWAAMITLKFFNDPLLAGRMVSVFAGLSTAIGLFFLGNELFRSAKDKIFSFTRETVSVGIISSFIYVIYPFGLVYDRMALYDSMVGMFSVWSLYLLLVLVRHLRLDVAMIAGLVIGGGLLTKTNAFFSLGSIPFLLILLNFSRKTLKERLIRFIGLSLIIFFLSYGMYSILRLSPFFHIIGEKNAIFAYPISEWIRHPFTYFTRNMSALLNWLFIYLSVPGIILVLASFVVKKALFREKVLLVLWFLFPFVYLAFFGNTIYPRFILFMTLPLLPLIAYSVYWFLVRYKSLFARALVLVFAFGLYLYADYFIVFNFSDAPIPKSDLEQYVSGWSAGNGVKQSVEFFAEQAKDKKIYIATEGTFGLMPFGLEMYLVDNENIEIEAFWPIEDNPPGVVLEKAKIMPVYAIFYQPCPPCAAAGDIPLGWKAEKIASYKQGTAESYYSIYRILP